MGPQIVVLAAGLGRRFGGDKQVAEVGPAGEWLLDYALWDARLAGFSEAILVVRPEMADLAERTFPLPVRLAFQDSPRGTAHALWSARAIITGPFAVINADDFYGRESYAQLARFLQEECGPSQFAVIGFPLGETLAESGPVARAILQTDGENYLTYIEELTGLTKDTPGIPLHALVSMNSWALDRSFLDFLEEKIPDMLREGHGKEMFLPLLIRQAMDEGPVRVAVLPARTRWMGITHFSDLEKVKKALGEMTLAGIYHSDRVTKSPGHYALLHPLRQTAFPAFFPTGKWVQTTMLKGGHIHLTALVEWEGPQGLEKTVFQCLNPSVFPDPGLLAENNAVIAGHLRAHSYPREILQPMYTPEGLSLVPTPAGPWRAFPYFSETYARTQAVDAGEVRKAAAAIGEWHTFLKDLDPGKIKPAIPRFFDLTHRWGQWEYAKANALSDRLHKAAPEIARLESGRHLVDQFERLRESDIFPLRILHGDPKLSNLLFDEKTKEIRAIIDWDTAQPGWIVFDFGDMVRAYTNPCAEDEPDPAGIKIHQPYLDALLDGFLSQTQHWLTPAERDHLLTGAQWVIWTQALRFLADYLIGDRYYPASYPEHNLVRGRNQLRLLERF